MGVSIIEGGSGNTVDSQERSDKSSQDNIFSEETEDGLIIPRFIYSKLSNYTDNKNITLVSVEEEFNEFSSFIMDMQRYSETLEDIDNISKLDEYLGSLGIDFNYPFQDDTYGNPLKLAEIPVSSYRNVVNGDDNIVVTIDTVTYNVIKTQETQGA